MRLIRLNDITYKRALSTTERILRSGGIVIGPTDTIYGIFGDATKPRVIKKIFVMKGRPREKALPIFVKDIATARKYAYISDAKAKFLEKIWPGAATVVFRTKAKLPQVLTGQLDTIGVRIPDYHFLLELLRRLDFPLVQTSANISGKTPAKNMEEVKEYFVKSKVKPDLVIDSGELPGRPSTVIDYTDKEPLVLRTGLISKTELDRILKFHKSG